MRKQKPYITAGIIIINIVVFIILSFLSFKSTGDATDTWFMYEHGAMYPDSVVDNGEVWRLLTCMFIHFGLQHIMNNMIMLIAAGVILEHALGHIKYLILYLLSGIAGSVTSLAVMINTGSYAVSAGASGAIFGVVGGLLWVVIRNKGRYESLSKSGMIFMIAIMIYYGVVTTGIDLWCHIGGLVGGFLLSIVLYRKKVYN